MPLTFWIILSIFALGAILVIVAGICCWIAPIDDGEYDGKFKKEKEKE